MYLDSIYLGLNVFMSPLRAQPRRAAVDERSLRLTVAVPSSGRVDMNAHQCLTPSEEQAAIIGNVPGRAEGCLRCGLEVGCSGAFRESSHVAVAFTLARRKGLLYRPETLNPKP